MRIVFCVIGFALVASACAAPDARPIPPAAKSITQAQTQVPEKSASTQSGTSQTAPKFDGKHAYDNFLIPQLDFGPRPAGSKAIRATGDFIVDELDTAGWGVETQEFEYRGIPIRNIIGKIGEGQGPLIILGAHYDTRPRADTDKNHPDAPTAGANDGASGVAVLLELARTLDKSRLKNEVWFVFFDAEDNGRLNACDLAVVEMQTQSPSCDTTAWGWSVGAAHMARQLTRTPESVVVIDMIGDADQNIYYEHNSDKELQNELWAIADRLGYRKWFIPEYRWTMTDDHTPFLERGFSAIDVIDFDYPPWHTTEDTADKVSADSLERVGRVLETWLER